MNSKIKTFANEKIIEYTGLLISLGLPILYCLISIAFYLKTYDSAMIKITLAQIGGTILIASWLIKIIEENAIDYFKRNAVLIVPLILFLFSGVISYLHSPLPLASLNELVRRIIYIFLALIVMKEFDNEKKIDILFAWLYVAVFVSAGYGIVQYLDYKFFPLPPEPGLDPFVWRLAFGSRVFSTFGNPNFFGDFLIVMGPIVLSMFMRKRHPFFAVLWLMIAFNVMKTYSKGAWLGFAVGILVFAFLYVGFFSHANKEKIRKILAGAVIGIFIFVGFGMFYQLRGRPDSASFRIFTWLSTWEMINTNPVLGTGIGTFYVTYPAWRRPQIFFIEGRHNTETDHPENEYLEVWYDEGTIGMGIFLWLLSLYLYLAFCNLKAFSTLNEEKKNGDKRAYIQLGVLTAIAAQLAHNFVCVSLRFVSSGVFLWLLIGLIGALNVNNNYSFRIPKLEIIPKVFRRLLQAGIIILSVYLIKIFYGYFDADINHNQAIFFSKRAQWEAALSHYRTVIKETPSFIMAHYFMGNVYNDRWGPDDANRAIDKYKDVWSLAPNYVQSHHQAGLIYLKWGEDEKRLEEKSRKEGNKKAEKEHREKKIELFHQALHEFEHYRYLDPIFKLNYYRMAWVYEQLGDEEKAVQMYIDHLTYPENFSKHPHDAWVENWEIRRWQDYSETSLNLGNFYYVRNKFDKAEENYLKSLEWNPKSVNAAKNLAVLYSRLGKVQQSIEYWNKVRTLAPKDPDVLRLFQQKK